MILPLASIILADGFTPFLDPLPMWQDSHWPWLLLPLCIAVTVVYKSIRCNSMKRVPREAAGLFLTIILGMAAAAIVLGLLVRGLESRWK